MNSSFFLSSNPGGIECSYLYSPSFSISFIYSCDGSFPILFINESVSSSISGNLFFRLSKFSLIFIISFNLLVMFVKISFSFLIIFNLLYWYSNPTWNGIQILSFILSNDKIKSFLVLSLYLYKFKSTLVSNIKIVFLHPIYNINIKSNFINFKT